MNFHLTRPTAFTSYHQLKIPTNIRFATKAYDCGQPNIVLGQEQPAMQIL